MPLTAKNIQMKTSKTCSSLLALTILSALTIAVPRAHAASLLLGVDFGTTNTLGGPPSPTFSGSESAATAANPVFGAANVWNGVDVPEYDQTPLTNPTFSNLVDNSGASTSVGLSFTGAVKGYSGAGNGSGDALRKDYIFLNSTNEETTSLAFAITGLTPGASYAFFGYGGNEDNGDFDLELDTTGTGVFMTQVVSGNAGTAYFNSVTANSSGEINGEIVGIGPIISVSNEADFAGFQLAQEQSNVATPEPSTVALLGLGGAAIFACWRRRRAA